MARRKSTPSCVVGERPVELHRFYLTRSAQGMPVQRQVRGHYPTAFPDCQFAHREIDLRLVIVMPTATLSFTSHAKVAVKKAFCSA
jgi:hypothetical protein